MTHPIDKKLQELRIVLPALSAPLGLYQPAVRAGPFVFVSGQLPMADGALAFKGRVPTEVNLENARRAAKICVINCLAALKQAIHSWDKLLRVVRIAGYVCSQPGFHDQPKVLNAASQLLLDILGDEVGSHTRVAVGSIELPMNAPVEVEMVAWVK